ncbi:hypothetical protein [Limimaricola sp. AA108-03]|uniref:hypothetical protein n=1 Tax=Limimaricola sp. AA108-03 TaxID=3425945 RepID=UPI003D77F175
MTIAIPVKALEHGLPTAAKSQPEFLGGEHAISVEIYLRKALGAAIWAPEKVLVFEEGEDHASLAIDRRAGACRDRGSCRRDSCAKRHKNGPLHERPFGLPELST